jgi:DNA-binding transcriptional ArsR family regulator
MNEISILDKAFDALANEKRRSIITSLSLQPLSISKLAQFNDLSLPAIHKHIKILEQAELVCRRKIGRTNFLVLNHDSLILVQQWLLQHQAHWGSAKATLENYAPPRSAQSSFLTNKEVKEDD